MQVTAVKHLEGGESVALRGTPFAVRCASSIVAANVSDAVWALEVLNRFGHLVVHPSFRAPPK